MRMPSKVVSVLCVVQVFIIGGGYAATAEGMRAYLKFNPEGAGPRMSHRYPQEITAFIGVHGLWFALIPVAWCLLAVWFSEATDDVADISGWQLLLGLALTFGLVGVFCFSAFDAASVAFS